MRFYIKAAVAVVLLVALAIWFGVEYALHRVPKFYQQAKSVPIARQKEAGEELERKALDLHNSARRIGHWSITLTEQQINGWLATGLPRAFPGLLPRDIRAPRIAISPDQIDLAFRYEDSRVSTVVHLALELTLAEGENVVAIRICGAHAGLFPLPLRDFVDQISAAANNADLDMTWSTQSADPVALIQIPATFAAVKKKRIIVDTIELNLGEVTLTGTTEKQ